MKTTRTMTTWRTLIAQAKDAVGDSGDLTSCTLSEAKLDIEFDNGFGWANGKPFTAWTETHVYFPLEYDGSEWAGSAPRNPPAPPTEHQGG